MEVIVIFRKQRRIEQKGTEETKEDKEGSEVDRLWLDILLIQIGAGDNQSLDSVNELRHMEIDQET